LGTVADHPGSGAPLKARGVGITDVGLQRDHNEDTFAVLSEHELFIVADGMGGHRAGDVASRLASESISDFFQRTAGEEVTWPFHFDSGLSESENRLLTAIRLANRQIYEHSLKSHDLRGMGTTVVGALFNPDTRKMYVGHVGDSRAYVIRDGQISQLTRDHSLVNDYLKVMPDMPEDQRSELPKNVITRALGMQDSVEVDLLAHDTRLGDTFVLCSDGLSGMISDAEILQVAGQNGDLTAAARRLTALANEHGGEDNITAVLVRIVEDDDPPKVDDDDDRVPIPTEPGIGVK
jgi:PPM family protein phosphatase